MNGIIEEIKKLADVPTFSKHERFVQGVINAINEKVVAPGDPMPSVNTLIKELSYSRETVVKAYKELVTRGIVESQFRQGYYIANGNTEQTLTVALLMYNLDTFEEQFYRNFRHELGRQVQLNTYFHHGNIEIFETILAQVKGKFGMYVIAPIPHKKTKDLLAGIPANKLLLFDRFENVNTEVNHITQEFEQSSYNIFSQLADRIAGFKEVIFYHSPNSLDPKEIVSSFKRFLKDFKLRGRIEEEYKEGSVQNGKVYFTLDNFALWQIMRDCKHKNLIPGTDVGVLSSNDEPAKEIIGITTFSADFADMGKKAGQAVMSKEKLQETVPMLLFRRNTL
ncbi:GntR family transcriptional regulator [Mucilaginibacter flavus]|uniref:GntR family transcriptional regulator n=1 Tax=Mucilaginibacter flavus TaxID=931504 RepID=UPI0025B3B636|nr:GntR family transcriptional regulator [Mucilaginibacter flavus]MDN3580745.1 GntR family transcriptional regulator [Mucilaginibacter flavus]